MSKGQRREGKRGSGGDRGVGGMETGLDEEREEGGFSGGSVSQEFTCQCTRHRFDPWSGEDPTC